MYLSSASNIESTAFLAIINELTLPPTPFTINLDASISYTADEFAEDVLKLVKSKITVNQLNALTSFAYNVGVANLQKSTLLKLVNINPNDGNIAKEFLKWNKANGKVLNGLTNRRIAESALYFTK